MNKITIDQFHLADTISRVDSLIEDIDSFLDEVSYKLNKDTNYDSSELVNSMKKVKSHLTMLSNTLFEKNVKGE